MNKIRSQPILIKLLIPIIGVTIGTITALTLFMLNNERIMLQHAVEQNIATMRESLIARGRILSNNLARQTEFNLDNHNTSALAQQFKKSASYDEELSYIVLMDKSGIAIINTGNPNEVGKKMVRPEDQFALRQQKPAINEFSITKGSANEFFTPVKQDMVEFVIPIMKNNQIWGYLRLGYSLAILDAKTGLAKQSLYDQINSNILNTVLISIGFIILGILATSIVSRKITHPLSDLSDWAQALSRGKFNASHSIKKDAFRELTLLVDSFEQMSKSLSESTQKLADYNQELTAKNKALEKASRVIEAADERKNELLDQIVSELKGPMQFIIGTNDVLLENEWVQNNRGFRSSLEMIQKTCQKLIDSTEELQGLKNMKIKTDAASIAMINSHDIIDGVSELMSHLLEGRLITFDIEDQVTDLHIQTDKQLINAAILNILRNAARFTQSGFIKLILKIKNRDLEIQISDSGIGIPPLLTKTIFEPGTQIRNGQVIQAEEETGAGMGLYDAKNNIAKLGGKIDINSSEGKGTVVTITVPEVLIAE